MERNSYVVFKDGHTEDIFYWQKSGDDAVLFATASGVYIHKKSGFAPGVEFGLYRSTNFFRVHLGGSPTFAIEAEDEYGISHFYIDDRIKVHYLANGSGGVVLVDKDATDEQIKLAILDDLDEFGYEKEY